MTLGWRGKKEFEDHFAFFDKMFRTLKKEGKINPDYTNFRNESELLIAYTDHCRESFQKLDNVIRDVKQFQVFLKDVTNYGIDEKVFMMTYTSYLMYLILMSYANIENMLLTILKGARYGTKKDDFVNGSETLAQLLNKIEKIYPKEQLPYEVIDTKFRNALAHGWYFINNEQIIYFEDAMLKKKKILTVAQLLRKHIRLNILGMAVTHLVLAMDY